MKKTLMFLLTLGALAFIAPAQAQHSADPIYLGGTAVTGGTNNLPGLSTNLYDTVTVTRGQYAAIQVQFKASDSGSTSNVIVRIDTSVDGATSGATNWMPNVIVYPIAAASTAQTTHATNILVGAIGYLRVSLCNTNASGAMTNIIVRVAQKPGI